MAASLSPSAPPVPRTAWLWPALLAAVIFGWSSRSTVPDVGFWIPHIDKVVHFTVFGFLAVLICRTAPGGRRARLAVVLTSLYGISDEWHQTFVPGRSAEVADWIADTLGAIAAVATYVRSARVRGWLETSTPIRRSTESPSKTDPLR